jgi:DHA3 family macrolide efflux protein-like MFS transporter
VIKNLTGMKAFWVVWVGQLVSLISTSMVNFGLTLWAYEETGLATALALVAVFSMVPLIVLSPISGVIVDRFDRKFMMIVSDAGAGIATILVLILFSTGRLEIWHLYISAFLIGSAQTFQWPALSSAMTTMLPKEQYGRAHGLLSLAEEGSNIFGPILAATAYGFIGLGAILWFDIFTFIFAIVMLLLVVIPQPKESAEGEASKGSFWSELVYGFTFIWTRKSLLGLQLVFMIGNFFATMGFTLLAPMILARTNNNALTLGSIQSIGAIGGVTGALLMSAWGGPKKLVHGVLIGWALTGLLAMIPMGLARTVLAWSIVSFIAAMIVPVINGSNQAIWQRKVPADIQGRVFSVRRTIAQLVTPIAALLAGVLADRWLEPGLMADGSLVPLFGWLVGTGPGAGMALLWVVGGIGATFAGLIPFALPVVRNAEELLADSV